MGNAKQGGGTIFIYIYKLAECHPLTPKFQKPISWRQKKKFGQTQLHLKGEDLLFKIILVVLCEKIYLRCYVTANMLKNTVFCRFRLEYLKNLSNLTC